MIIKGDKSNLAEECSVKVFEQGVRNKEFQQTSFNTANIQKCVEHISLFSPESYERNYIDETIFLFAFNGRNIKLLK